MPHKLVHTLGKIRPSNLAIPLVLLLCGCARATAQDPESRLGSQSSATKLDALQFISTNVLPEIPQPGPHFRYPSTTIGDIDNDGVADILLGSDGDKAGPRLAGCAKLISGQSGDLLTVIRGESGDRLGYSVCRIPGNVRGQQDLLAIGTTGGPVYMRVPAKHDSGFEIVQLSDRPGFVRLYSTAGQLVREFRGDMSGDGFGRAICALQGNIEQDLPTLIAVGAPISRSNSDPNGGHVYLIDCDSGSIRFRLHGSSTKRSSGKGYKGDSFGTSIASCADLDGDGVGELIVGSPERIHDSREVGAIEVFSGRTGELLHRLLGDCDDAGLGYSVVCLGDLNGDGVDEFAGSVIHRYVRVFSGADGSVLYTVKGRSYRPDASTSIPDGFGESIAAIGDIDRDGYKDFAIASWDQLSYENNSGYLVVVSGASGQLIDTLEFSRPVVVASYDSALTGPGRVLIASPLDQQLALFSLTDRKVVWKQ